MKDCTGFRVKAFFVQKKNASIVKHRLQEVQWLNKDFRMVPVSAAAILAIDVTSSHPKIKVEMEKLEKEDYNRESALWIAIPVLEIVTEEQGRQCYNSNSPLTLVEAIGYCWCPFSTKNLGNDGQWKPRSGESIRHLSREKTVSLDKLSLLQLVILNLEECIDSSMSTLNVSLIERMQRLDPAMCPLRLERFGDDRTLVLPQRAFEGEEFLNLLREVEYHIRDQNIRDDSPNNHTLLQDFWRRLAQSHNSPRIVRKGGIDPNSKIRESGHRLVWPFAGIPKISGPNSPGWICVTEQGIKQSFDMTRVMFSRGNISEKIRFGKLVKEGEIVLDMYAGIGYYTLPAVVHGKASLVYACEWNEHAANALKYNVSDNKISDKVKILVGDCRELAQTHNLFDVADRVSLGLLPSSEGGWRTAIRALKKESGGWLHVHGNVPVKEKESWTLWVCAQLSNLVKCEHEGNDWIVLCTHIERVKSFAPTVCHYVADIFVGSPEIYGPELVVANSVTRAGILLSDSTYKICPTLVEAPSCALSPDGALCQEWMR
jgi:16S rRNA G966 N2-methylase RsmD